MFVRTPGFSGLRRYNNALSYHTACKQAGMSCLNNGSAELAERLNSGLRRAATGFPGGLFPTCLQQADAALPVEPHQDILV